MCILCDDENAYAVYMDYLDAFARQGQSVDPEQALDAVLDALEKSDAAKRRKRSPFICDPVDS